MSKLALGLFLAGFLLCVFSYEALCDVQAPTVQGWQIEDRGGYFFESGGVIRFWSDGGSNCPSLILYKQIAPMGDFNFSLQVNAATLESFGVFVRSNLPFSGGKEGFNFEFGHYGAGMFLLARRTLMDDWLGSHFADGVENVWYTMHLSVNAESFSVEATVLDENGTLLGSYSASDMSNISFEDIKYIGFGVWGYSPTDYSVRNIVDPFANPSCISISAEASSTTAGSAVNVTGTLSDSNGTALPNKLVVLSYTFPGIDSWIPISSCLTDETGEYSIQWINSASGTFTLKTEWSGGGTYIGASNTTTLSFLPYDSQKVFFVESNSTISALAFNSTSSELSFTASGPSGTSGYVKTTIAKSLVSNSENIKVYLDKEPLNYSIISTPNSWQVTFSYSHSTHRISMHFEANAPTTPSVVDYMLGAAILAFTISGAVIGVVAWKRSGGF